MENDKKVSVGSDFMVEAGVDENGDRVGLRVRPDGSTCYQTVKPLQEGEEPAGGEAVVLHGSGPVYSVQPAPPRAKGPAKVSNESYRSGWDAIFGKKPGQNDLNLSEDSVSPGKTVRTRLPCRSPGRFMFRVRQYGQSLDKETEAWCVPTRKMRGVLERIRTRLLRRRN